MSQRRSKILVIQWARLGDLFHSRPLCEAALRKFTLADLTFCCDERYEDVVREFPEVDSVLPVNLSKIAAQLRTDASLPDALADLIDLQNTVDSHDVVINLTNHPVAIQLARTVSAQIKLGYGLDGENKLSEIEPPVNAASQPKHVASIWASLVEDSYALTIPMCIATEAESAKISSLGIICDAGSPERSLTPETLNTILAILNENQLQDIVLLGANTGEAVSFETARDLRGKTTLAQLRSILGTVEMVIGPDTGALHFAAALGKKVFGIYLDGAKPEQTGPLTANSNCITAQAQDISFQLHLRKALNEWVANRSKVESELCTSSKLNVCPLSIVIPEYGQTHYADRLLECLSYCELPKGAEIIVMSSGLDTLDLRIALERQNVLADATQLPRTFAQVCNRGAGLAKGEWLLLLNDDCEITKDSFTTFWQNRCTDSILGPILRNWDGTIQSAGFIFDGIDVREIVSTGVQSPITIDGVSAAAMLIERNTYFILGGFDPNFQNGYEDVDFCLRAGERGVSVKLVGSSVTHYKGSSPGRYFADDQNLKYLQEKWSNAKKAQRHLSSRIKHPATSLIIISDELSDSAGALLRWIDPLKRCGLKIGKDFNWISTSNTDAEGCRLALQDASAVIIFRSVSNSSIRKEVLHWQMGASGPLCYDCDDLLTGRFTLGSRRETNRRIFEDGIRELVQSADILTAPNALLFEQFDKVSGRRIVLETKPLPLHISARVPKQKSVNYRIGYAGSAVHQTDFAIVAPALEELLESDETVQFYWWGTHPGRLSNHPQVRRGGEWMSDYAAHVRRIQKADIDLWIAPLGNAPHNTMRSAIKAFEYIGCDAPCLFSNVAPFSRTLSSLAPHLLVNNHTSDWVDAIKHWHIASESSTYNNELSNARKTFATLSQNRTSYKQFIRMLPLNSLIHSSHLKEAVSL